MALVDPVAWSRRMLEQELALDDGLELVEVGELDVGLCGAVAALEAKVVLLSLSAVGSSELQLIGDLRALSVPPRVALLTDAADPATILAARGRGVGAYLVRSDEMRLSEAVRVAAAGGVLLSPTAAAAADVMLARALEVLAPAKAEQEQELTGQQMRVLMLVAEGGSNAAIAAQLQIGVNTVKSHVSRLLVLLGQPDRKQLIAYAHSQRLFLLPIDAEAAPTPGSLE